MRIRKKDVAARFSPGRMQFNSWNMVHGAPARWKHRRQTVIGRENGAWIIGINYEADFIAQVPVVELDEIGRGPARQICRTSEEFGCEQRARQRDEVLKRKIKRSLDLIAGGDEFQRTAVVGGDLRRKFSAVIIRKQMGGEAGLFQIAHTLNPSGPGLAAFQRRQQQRGEDADDGDHGQQFHQRERTGPAMGLERFHAHL